MYGKGEVATRLAGPMLSSSSWRLRFTDGFGAEVVEVRCRGEIGVAIIQGGEGEATWLWRLRGEALLCVDVGGGVEMVVEGLMSSVSESWVRSIISG